jgi:hypothetical protein
MTSKVKALGTTLKAGGCFLSLAFLGCQAYELPRTGPSQTAVLEAAKSVIQERYPMSAASERPENGAFVTAVTLPAMDGGLLTRKQISVIMRQNYTGAWEPVVTVRQYMNVATPSLEGDPGNTSPALAVPLDEHRWRSMGYLEYEQDELTQAIFQKLNAAGP